MNGEQIYCFKDYTKVNVYKIGKTTQGWQKRLKDLNRNTGSVDNNALEATLVKKVDNCHEAEAYLHRNLKVYRILNSKEFFNVDIDTVKYWFDKISGRYIVNNIPSAQLPTEHVTIPMEVPTAVVLNEPFIVQNWSGQQRQPCITRDTVNKALCVLCAIGTLIILVTVIIFVAQREGSE